MINLPAAIANHREGHLVFDRELGRLMAVHRLGAIEGAIFYAGRVLEGLCGIALGRAHVDTRPTALAGLESLQDLAFAPMPTLWWGHVLRRLGNVGRHLRGELADVDADIAVAVIELWLHWYFVDFSIGPRIVQLRPQGISLGAPPSARAVVQASTGTPAELEAAAHALCDGPQALRAAAQAAVMADLLIAQGKRPLAERVLQIGLAQYPEDLRLLQLKALALSRGSDRKKLEEALASLEALAHRFEDAETLGILAGAYKRRSDPNVADDWLAKAHRKYAAGFRIDKKSTYLGINTAATALWLGHNRISTEVAHSVYALQNARLARRAAAAADLPPPEFWAEVTLAEAALLLGRLDEAGGLYASALATHPLEVGSHQVALAQARRHLKELGSNPSLADGWAARATTTVEAT